MANDHRLTGLDGGRLPFTCGNRRFMTDLSRGYAHSVLHADSTGSVLPDAVFDFGEASIWLEHVVDRHSGERCFWLMWYNAEGKPTIPMSGVFGVDEIERASSALRDFVASVVMCP
jgi:hypothetical protein